MSPIQYFRDKSVGNIHGWHWIGSDSGAWEGPAADWEHAHYPNILTHCHRRGTVIQAGGNCGMYPKLLSRLFNKVYTFEPDTLNFQCLTMNCTEENIVKMQAALGDKNDVCVMNRLTMYNVGMHKVSTDLAKDKAVIPIVKLDSFEFKDVALLMLDLEGYELYAIKGAINTINENKPVIFVERPSNEVHDLLSSLGYKIGSQSAMDTVYII